MSFPPHFSIEDWREVDGRRRLYKERFAEFLRLNREPTGYTAKQAAELAGTHTANVTMWEKAASMPPWRLLQAISRVYENDARDFLKGVFESVMNDWGIRFWLYYPDGGEMASRIEWMSVLMFLDQPFDMMPYEPWCCQTYLACKCAAECFCLCPGCPCSLGDWVATT